uniref:Uncharacterized protein n=2 Tax=Anguilla anguilla TaxID=7936 RepID=A0A0E9SPD6_ANGAN
MAKMFSFRFVTKSLYFVSFLTFHLAFNIWTLFQKRIKVCGKKKRGDLMCVGQRCQTQGQSPTSSQQMQDAEEMVPLSPPEQNTAHRQEA